MGSEHEIILYQTDETRVCVSVYYRDETFWMTQKALSELFDCGVDNISIHLKNIYDEKELSEEATVEFFSIVQQEGNRKVTRRVKCYNLDAIIAVGYRVNSKRRHDSANGQQKRLRNILPKVLFSMMRC